MPFLLEKMIDALEKGGESAEMCMDMLYDSGEISSGAPRSSFFSDLMCLPFFRRENIGAKFF